MTITRLGEGVDATRRLAARGDGAHARGTAGYRSIMDAHDVVPGAPGGDLGGPRRRQRGGVPRARRPRSSACRRSCCRARRRDGCPTPAQPPGSPRATAAVVVVDIGGGSTEIVTLADGEVRSVSLDIGCVRLTERFLRGDPPSADEVARAVERHRRPSSSVPAGRSPRWRGRDPTTRLVGSGGNRLDAGQPGAGAGGLRQGADPPRRPHPRRGGAVVRGPRPGNRGRAGAATRPSRWSPGRDLRWRPGAQRGDAPVRPARVHRLGGRHPRRPGHVDAVATPVVAAGARDRVTRSPTGGRGLVEWNSSMT